jgi:hypothetical protein
MGSLLEHPSAGSLSLVATRHPYTKGSLGLYGPSVHHLNHLVLAAALVAEIQSVQLVVLDQK